MSGRFDDLIPMAAGTAAQVAGWCKLLRARNVQFVTASSCAVPEDSTPDHVELWIHKDDLERAQRILEEGKISPFF